MEVNHNNNKTLPAYDGNEEMRFYKKISHGMHHQNKH
jgi:hypothetical protein